MAFKHFLRISNPQQDLDKIKQGFGTPRELDALGLQGNVDELRSLLSEDYDYNLLYIDIIRSRIKQKLTKYITENTSTQLLDKLLELCSTDGIPRVFLYDYANQLQHIYHLNQLHTLPITNKGRLLHPSILHSYEPIKSVKSYMEYYNDRMIKYNKDHPSSQTGNRQQDTYNKVKEFLEKHSEVFDLAEQVVDLLNVNISNTSPKESMSNETKSSYNVLLVFVRGFPVQPTDQLHWLEKNFIALE